MNKTTLKVLVLALAVLFPMQNVFAEYCTNFGNSTHAARYLNAFTLTDGTNEAVVSSICTSTGQAVYHDKTSVVLETEAGATISFSSITWNGEWMHGYAFADFNNDGTFDAEDVVSYNFYSATDAATGENSKGETVQNSCNVTAANMPEWTIPATLAPGDYRFRFKVDWCNLDPCGASDIAGNGGAVVDVTIRIASQAAARTISVSVSPEETGTVTINGEEVSEVTAEGGITLVATPAEGYKFANWTLDGEVVSTNATFIDGTDGDKAYVANFAELTTLSVSVSVNDDTMGYAYASVEGTVLEGTEITLTATPAEGYDLENWTVNGEVVSEETSFVTTVTTSTEFVANFKVKSNKITIASIECSEVAWATYTIDKAIDNDYSTNYESNNYPSNGTTVTATFDTNKVLDKVVVYFSGSSFPVQGKFQISNDGLTWTDIEGSTFTSSQKDSNNAITVDCKKVVAKNIRLNIDQVALAYLKIYEFEVYGKDLSVGERTISVSVNDATMGTAYIGEEGVTEVADSADPLQLVAVANEGYEFINWTVDGEAVSTDASIFDTTDGDKTYVANFIPLAQCTVSVSVNDAMMGSATASQTGEMFKYTEVTFEATANEGYELVNWTIGDSIVSKSATFTAVIEESAEYKANFRVTPTKLALESVFASFTLSTLPNIIDGRMSSESYKQLNANGETVTVVLENESAIGDIALYFYNSISYQPSKAKIQVSSDNETYTDVEGCSFVQSDLEGGVIVLDAKGVSAKYVRLVLEETSWFDMWEFEVYEAPVNVAPRQISVSVNDASMGTAYVGTESVTSVSNQTGAVRIVATATENAYRFVNWTVNGEEVATTATFVDRTEGDKAYVANFEAKPIYTVGVSSIDESKGTASSDAAEVVYEGDAITFTATPADGYKFTAWTNGTDTVSVANPYTVTIEESIALVANFDRDPKLDRSNWTITASSQEATGEGVGNGVATCMIDGKSNTFWHSQWSGSEPAYPHWFMIDLQASKAFDAFEYVSRGTGTNSDGENNGNILNYTLYVSDTEIDPTALDAAVKVTEGQFTYDGTTNVHKVEFNSVKARYVMLYATGQSANGKKNASCVEFYLYSNAFAVAVSSSNPEIGTAYIGEEGVTSVGCSVEGTDVVTLTAVPADKYQFVNWTLNGEVVSTDAVYTTTAVTESRAYVANFEFAPVAPRTITAAVNNAAKGSVVFLAPESTETSVVSDNIVVVKAVPATTDEFFVNWTINGVEVGTEETYEYLDAADVTIQANFESRYVVTIDQVTGGTIYVKSAGNTIASGERVLEGNYITISVSENNRSELKKLFVNGEDVFVQYKYNPDFAVKVTGSITITAEYGEPRCIVTWENIGSGYVEVWEYDTYDEEAEAEGTLELPVSPAGEQYAYGDEVPFLTSVAIFAMPKEGEELQALSINGNEINLEEEYFLYGDYYIGEIESALHIVATFSGEYWGVEDAEAETANVYAVADGIKVVTAEVANVSIYTIAGVLVSEQTVSETTTIAMEKGVYIVKVADKVAKVVVK